jgi:hypothetical protein
MTTKNLVLVLLINFGAGLLAISSFLPGPPNAVVNLLYSAGQILGLLGLFVIPFGLIWTIRELRKKRNKNEYKCDVKAIVILTLPVTLFLTAIYFSGNARGLSRNFAINRTNGLIKSIDRFKDKNGEYPESLTELTPEFISKIPSPFIMGINDYSYRKQGNTYTISFYQNVTFNFNYEVVTFDPTDNHTADGESTTIYETGQSHWKYYVYD